MFTIYRSENTPVIKMRLTSILTITTILIIVMLGAGCTSASTTQSCTRATNQEPAAYVSQVAYLEINPTEINDARIGNPRQFTATVYDEDDNVISGAKVSWKITSGSSRATITSKGNLHPKAVGEVEVTASFGGESVTAYVNIRKSSSYRYTSNDYYNNDDDNHHDNDVDSFDDDLPPDHCYYVDDFTEEMAAKRVPCNR